MKNLLIPALMTCVITVTRAQPPIQIEYLFVPDEEVEKHERYQRKDVMEYHQKLLNDGKIYAWYHYKSRFPIGSSSFYNYVIVTVCRDYEVLNERNEFVEYERFVAGREIYYPDREIRSPDYGVVRTPFITVDFLRSLNADKDDYKVLLSEKVKPLLDQRVSDMVVTNYSIFHLQETSMQVEYDHVLVTRCHDIQGAENPSPIELKSHNTRVKTVLWQLRDIVF